MSNRATRWLVAVALLLFLVACTRSQTDEPQPPPWPRNAWTQENQGELCLEPTESSYEIQPILYPDLVIVGCTREVQRLADVRVDKRARTIRFFTRIVLVHPDGLRLDSVPCPAASRHLRPLEFDRLGGDIPNDIYAVWWGDRKIADLDFGALPDERICASSRPTEPPTPTRSGPTRTPVPTWTPRPAITPGPTSGQSVSPLSPLPTPAS